MGFFWAVVGVLGVIALAYGLARLNVDSTKRMDPTADDVRRADDGRPDEPFIDYGNPMG